MWFVRGGEKETERAGLQRRLCAAGSTHLPRWKVPENCAEDSTRNETKAVRWAQKQKRPPRRSFLSLPLTLAEPRPMIRISGSRLGGIPGLKIETWGTPFCQ